MIGLWSLLYSAVLRSRADSLRSHVILYEWLAFYSASLNIPPKWCTCSAGMAGTTRIYCRLGAFCVHHTTMHHVASCKATYVSYNMFSNNLTPALLAEWPGRFTCYCGSKGGGTDNEIRLRVSTESWLWRIKFSRRSCRDSNTRPFNQESGALITELSRCPW